jgi:hypothetical protein
MQKNGAGLHTASTCFWDTKSDGPSRDVTTSPPLTSPHLCRPVALSISTSKLTVSIWSPLVVLGVCRFMQRALGQCHDARDRHCIRTPHLSDATSPHRTARPTPAALLQRIAPSRVHYRIVLSMASARRQPISSGMIQQMCHHSNENDECTSSAAACTGMLRIRRVHAPSQEVTHAHVIKQ